VLPRWAWSGSREQFQHSGLRKFRHSKSSVHSWYKQLVCGRFVYDTYRTMEVTRTRHGWVHMYITHCPTVTLQLRNFDLFRTSRTSSYCTVAWQLARFQLTRRNARSLGDSWASCLDTLDLGQKKCVVINTIVRTFYSPMKHFLFIAIRFLSDSKQIRTFNLLSHFVTQRPSAPEIQRPGDPVDPGTLFYNELQMSTFLQGCANRVFYCSSTLSSIFSSTLVLDKVSK